MDEYNPLCAKSIVKHYHQYSSCWKLEMYKPRSCQSARLVKHSPVISAYIEFNTINVQAVESDVANCLEKGFRYLPFFHSEVQEDEYVFLMYWRLVEDGIFAPME